MYAKLDCKADSCDLIDNTNSVYSNSSSSKNNVCKPQECYHSQLNPSNQHEYIKSNTKVEKESHNSKQT